MRLYPKNAPIPAVDHPEYGHFDADPDHGGFDFPDELSDEMHSYRHRGKPIWETEDERSVRMRTEDLGRRRDPAELYDAVGGFTDALRQMAGNLAPAHAAADDRDAVIAELRARVAELEGTVATPLPADAGETTEAAEGDPAPAETAAGDKPPAGRRPPKAAKPGPSE